jgi:transposase-like protein
MRHRKGIWCPRHPEEQLVRISFPNGKIDLRCPACTSERVAKIGLVEDREPRTAAGSLD